VAEHALSFYFALRRNIVGMHAKMVNGNEEWKGKGSLISYVSRPFSCLHFCTSEDFHLERTSTRIILDSIVVTSNSLFWHGNANLGSEVGWSTEDMQRRDVMYTRWW